MHFLALDASLEAAHLAADTKGVSNWILKAQWRRLAQVIILVEADYGPTRAYNVPFSDKACKEQDDDEMRSFLS